MEPILFACSSCGRTLKVGADKAGCKTRCPQCGTSLTVPTAGAARAPRRASPARKAARATVNPSRAEEDEEGEEFVGIILEDPRSREEDEEERVDEPRRPLLTTRQRWASVRIGVTVVFVGVALLTAGYVLRLLPQLWLQGMMTARQPMDVNTFRILGIVGQVAGGILLVAALVTVVGYPFCLPVPNKRGTLPLAILVVGLGGINILLRLVALLLTLSGGLLPSMTLLGTDPWVVWGVKGGWFVGLFVKLLWYLEWIVFPLFLWATGRVLRNHRATGIALMTVIGSGVTLALHLLIEMLRYLLLHSAEHPAGTGVLLQALDWILTFTMLATLGIYLVALKQTRDAIPS